MTLPVPRYSLWDSVKVAIAVSQRALEEVRALSRLPGPRGEPGERGERGADALGFDDLSVTYDGERNFVFRFARGDQVKEFPFTIPVLLDRGVWKEGTYAKGDGVTWGGSFWIAQKDTATKPDTPGSDWRLSIKRGRDGKDGKNGERGLQGSEGKPGRDGKGW